MEIGICAAPAELERVCRQGWDYLEVSGAALAGFSDPDFELLAGQNRALRSARFGGCRACNGLFPGGLALVGPARSEAAISDYLEKLTGRLQQLGVETVVFGSGSARRCPEGFDRERALEQAAETACLLGDIAGRHSIAVGIEPLNDSETNLLTTYAEAAAFVQRLRHPNVSVMADLYHLHRMGEPLGQLAAVVPCHCHVAAFDRSPVGEADRPALAELAAVLKKAGYAGRLSLEAVVHDPDAEAPAALKVLRSVFGA